MMLGMLVVKQCVHGFWLWVYGYLSAGGENGANYLNKRVFEFG
jgi:hypothetical protein